MHAALSALRLPAAVAFCVAVFAAWASVRGPVEPVRTPHEDGAPPKLEAGRIDAAPTGPLPGTLVAPGPGKPSALAGAWPCFRGEARDNAATGQPALATSWPEAGPPLLWTVEVGEGYAGPAVRDGRVFVFDYDAAAGRDALRALSLEDGAEIWRCSWPLRQAPNHGVSRTVPAVARGRVVGLSPSCHLVCLEAETGEFRWRFDLPAQFGTKIPAWYAGQCVLVDGDRVLFAPAGRDALLAAADLETGRLLWTCPNPHRSAMSHASLALMEFGGRRMAVYAGTQGVVAAAVEDGAILWDSRAFRWHTIAPTPLILPGGRVLLTTGYDAETVILRVTAEGRAFRAEEERRLPPRVWGSYQQTPILDGERILAVVHKPRQELVCTDLSLREIWASGPERRFGWGPYLRSGKHLLLLDDEGWLTLAEAAEAFRPLARARILPGPDAWAPLALVDGRLLARDHHRLVCLDLREERK